MLVLLWGDHGTRFGNIRLTKPGKLEERMPMNKVILPTEFLKNKPYFASSLYQNQQRLVTPYDYHATFEHIIAIANGKPYSPTMPYQESIFIEHSPKRACAGANVNDHHCICYKRIEIPTTEQVVQQGSQLILNHLNSIITEDTFASEVCHTLKMRKMLNAELLVSHPDPIFQIQFSVYPGPSTFEGTFRWIGNKTVELVPYYSRLTSYVGGSCGVKTHIMRVCVCKRKKNK
jgi:hypothetical protein